MDYGKQGGAKAGGNAPRQKDHKPGKGGEVYPRKSPQAELLERMKKAHAEKADKSDG